MSAARKTKVTLQGRLLTVRGPDSWTRSRAVKRKNPTPRGRVRGFSKPSRRRLRRAVARVGWRPALFITLTAPEDWPDARDPARMKYRLFRFIREFLIPRLPSRHAIFWKMEYTQDAKIHFHILVFTRSKPPYIDWEDMQQAWGAFVWVELARAERVAWYVSKYVSKPRVTPGGGSLDPEFIPEKSPGRFWGLWNRAGYLELLPPPRTLPLGAIYWDEVQQFIAWMRERGYSTCSFTVELRSPPP